MASTKVRGITIELGADTSGISSALKEVNSEIGSTSRQLKDVERLLKLDPGNTELLAQKQRLLSDSVSETAKKLDTLKEAQKEVKKVFDETGEGQDQYDALTREIVKTEAALRDAEAEAKKFNATATKIGAAADGLADKFSKAASKTKALSAGAAGVLGALGGLAYKTAQNADELNTLAKQTGFTTEELQKMQYAADRIDVDMDTITGAAAKMTRQLSSGADKFEEIGVSVNNADGSFRSVTDIFYDTVQALSQIPDETQRDVVAMEIFGRSANDLAGIIDDGGESLRALGDEAATMGLIIPQDQIDQANELNDAIDKVKAESMGAFAQLGTEIAEMLLPYIPEIVAGIEKVLQVIKDLDPNVIKIVVGILAFTSILSPLFTALSGLMTVISGLSTALTFLAANPIVLLIAAIVGLVALIATKGDEIQAIFKKVDDFLQGIFTKDWTEVFGPVLGGILNGFFENLKNIWDAIYKIFDGVIDFIRGVFTGDWDRAWMGVYKIFLGIFNLIEAAAKAPLNGVIGLVNLAINAINSLIDGFNSIGFDLPSWLGGGSWHPSIPRIPNIPYLAKGGVVSEGSAIVGEAGAELLTVSNGRAYVQPIQNKSVSVGETVINVYGAPGQDINELADIISERIDARVQRTTQAWA